MKSELTQSSAELWGIYHEDTRKKVEISVARDANNYSKCKFHRCAPGDTFIHASKQHASSAQNGKQNETKRHPQAKKTHFDDDHC